ncbi:MAG: ATP-dependent zinc metalloprotease FtsH, partial [Candidatus Cloacimonetes bacterium]|nr:ATP-dependent zinc metalloprotease FtsH [Candidatus Cloacimonadota bacterium]
LLIKDTAGNKYHTYLPPETTGLTETLVSKSISVKSTKPSLWRGLFWNLLPILLLIGFWLFMMRGMNNNNSKAFSFGKSRARLYKGDKTRITFADVAGVEEAKEELEEIVEFLKDPKKYQRLGGRIPRGVLLAGRPGTGKTLLAKAVAGEAGVPFFSISGSDFVEMFVGVGAARVRDLFEQAKRSAPCIAFIDEIDAVGRHRGSGLGGGHDEREQTLNQLLVQMDGFEDNEAVIIIAATNRPDILDPALLRPGRFDRQVMVDLPDINGRYEILKVHSKKVPLAETANLKVIARATPGFSGADLANLVNEAALIAARKGKKKIESDDFEDAKDKVTLGKAKKSRVISDDEKQITAYHEVGHVLCSIFQEKTEPVHKVTIIPRGFTGGATHYMGDDKSNYSKQYLSQMIVSLLGGRAAEEVKFNELTTGAGNDIDRATEIARKMVTSWGMSEKIGPIRIGKEQEEVFLGKEIGHRDFFSEETAHAIDSEIRKIMEDSHTKAISILKENFELLEIMSERLLVLETLNSDEIFDIIFENCHPEMRSLVEKKFQKANEMRFDDRLNDTDENHATLESEQPDLFSDSEIEEIGKTLEREKGVSDEGKKGEDVQTEEAD